MCEVNYRTKVILIHYVGAEFQKLAFCPCNKETTLHCKTSDFKPRVEYVIPWNL
jgi:hypothetical protein